MGMLIGPQPDWAEKNLRSLRFNSPDSAYLSRTPSVAGNRKTWTWAGWVKRSGLSSTQRIFSSSNSSNTEGFYCELVSGDTLSLYDYSNPTIFWQKTTSQVFRDVSAWFHLQVTFDSTNATAGDRVKLYVNGVLVTDFGTSTNPSLNYDSYWNAARAHAIGRTGDASAGYFSGYLTDIHFIDGQALDASNFGYFDDYGIWQPKRYFGPFGTNGFFLNFADNSSTTALGYDTSGNNNHWTPNNFSVTAGAGNDSFLDHPRNFGVEGRIPGGVRGNYATLNPLSKQANAVLANGNLDWSRTNTSSMIAQSTIAMSTGKWYCEFTATASNQNMFGIQRTNGTVTTLYVGGNADSWGYFAANGNKYNNNVNTSYGATYGAGDVIGVAFDADNGTLTFYKNGVSQGVAYSELTNGPYTFAIGNGAAGTTASVNFGQRPFAYQAPAGYKALCTANLPDPVVAQPSTVMDVKLYTGNGSTQTISGLGFEPDLVWVKRRSAAASNVLGDVVRGITKSLYSNLTSQELDTETDGYISAVTSDGFTVVPGASSANQTNASASTYVAWTWDAGSSTVSNTDGSITSSVRANASAGFSIVTYTGTGGTSDFGHGLNVKPGLVIIKNRTTSGYYWIVGHSSLASNQNLYLNDTISAQTYTSQNHGGIDLVNSTSSVVELLAGVQSADNVNRSGNNYVAYCFAPVEGYSAFGSYTGNGSTTDNTFVYTGMRPRFVMLKRSDSTGNWVIWDAVRNTYNVANSILLPNSSAAEYSPDAKIDILSNGFKVRDNSTDSGTNGATYIYAAFAEHPFSMSRAR